MKLNCQVINICSLINLRAFSFVIRAGLVILWIHHVVRSISIPDATWGAEIARSIICMCNPCWLHAAGLGNAKTEPSFAERTQACYRSHGLRKPRQLHLLGNKVKKWIKTRLLKIFSSEGLRPTPPMCFYFLSATSILITELNR